MSSASNSSKFRVGYALSPRKIQSFITPSLVSYALDRGIDLIPIDPQKPLIDQGPFHSLIHKLRTHDWNTQLLDLKSHCPDIVIIDPPEAIEPLNNRMSMLEFVNRLGTVHSETTEKMGVPKQVTVMGDVDSLLGPQLLEELKIPLIAKPLISNGSLNSHEMCLVLNRDGLKEVKPPVVLQQFVNHGGVVFKVYVAGQHVKCVKRKSVPDIPKEKLDMSMSILRFSQISNLTKKPQQEQGDAFFGGLTTDRLVEEAEMPSMSFLMVVARGLRRALGINLFNFDLIRDADAGDTTSKYLVIDINYFPGYAKLPGFETMMTDFLLDVAKTKEGEEGREGAD